MEGFIPMVLKRFKRSKTRREYSPLSTPPARGYDIVDFYPNGYNFKYETEMQPYQDVVGGGVREESKFSQWRSKSVNHVSYAAGAGAHCPEDSVKSPRQLVRFRSHRRMFSCITGA